MKRLVVWVSVSAMVVCQMPAQVVERPTGNIILRPYRAAVIAPLRLGSSSHVQDFIRAGKIYLTAQDAIALAIENNLELEVERYNTVAAEWAIERAQAGGPIRGVTSGSSQIGSVASGQGINGSQASLGLTSNFSGSATPAGNAIVQQIGTVTPNLDPVLLNTSVFSHLTYPQSNAVQSRITALVDNVRSYSTSLQEGFLTGGYVRINGSDSYLKENTPTDVLNPSVAPRGQIYAQHSLLQGFGKSINDRFIRVALNNQVAADETFRSRLINVVTQVLNLYWDLVNDEQDLRARREARDIAQRFADDTRTQIRIGTVARVEISRAEGELANRQEQLALAESTELMQQNLLKNAISRDGFSDAVADLPIVPTDTLEIPEKEDLPPLRQLVLQAMAQRPDIAATQKNTKSAELSTLGTSNGLLPTLTGFASLTDSGLSGTPNPGAGADPYFAGGLGNALGQVFRRNFPTNRVGLSLNSVPVFVDHIDQGDYAIDQLQFRQTQLSQQREINQLAVDVSNQVVALRQARARHNAAKNARLVQEQLMAGQEKKFSLSSSTINAMVAARQSLAAAGATELAALAAYKHARIALDQVLGTTLDVNHVSVAQAGRFR
jgi:outer membrane protein